MKYSIKFFKKYCFYIFSIPFILIVGFLYCDYLWLTSFNGFDLYEIDKINHTKLADKGYFCKGKIEGILFFKSEPSYHYYGPQQIDGVYNLTVTKNKTPVEGLKLYKPKDILHEEIINHKGIDIKIELRGNIDNLYVSPITSYHLSFSYKDTNFLIKFWDNDRKFTRVTLKPTDDEVERIKAIIEEIVDFES